METHHDTISHMLRAAPFSTWNPETVRAVAVAYRRQRRAGQPDQPAYEAALAAYRERHPRALDIKASDDVSRMIASVARETPCMVLARRW